jgi:hypothetical protein
MKVNPFFLIVFLLIFVLTGCIDVGFCVNTKKSSTSQYLVYENKKLGFVLQIPKSWNGYYIINDNDDCVEVNFVGKSKMGKNVDVESNKMNGLTMFYIASEKYVKNNELVDNVREIGSSRKDKYYYFTSSDYPIGVLFDTYNDPELKDEEEKSKAHDDYLKAKQMEKDIKGIIKSFKAK